MPDKNTGGPAFPENNYLRLGDAEQGTCNPGMTLRDYFAGQACANIVEYFVKTESFDTTFDDMANTAYAMADAMIKERTK